MTHVMTSQQENYQNRQKCEMQWMFGIQAIPDTCDTKY